MENFLIVIIFIGSIIYKIYSNYKEEVAKAKKRNPHQQTTIPVETYAERDYKKEKKSPIPRSVTNSAPASPYIPANYASTYNDIPEEVSRVSAARAQKRATAPLKVETNEPELIEFDLRQAFIHTIILERPYK